MRYLTLYAIFTISSAVPFFAMAILLPEPEFQKVEVLIRYQMVRQSVERSDNKSNAVLYNCTTNHLLLVVSFIADRYFRKLLHLVFRRNLLLLPT